MTRNLLVLLAACGSAGLLAGAFFYQALGYPPCAMCLWQRWPHVAAILIAVVALNVNNRLLLLLGAAATAATSAIGIFHTGVEKAWWQGPTSCTGNGGLNGLSGSDLLSLDGPRVAMCDQVSWEFAGLSMASWNALLSLVLFGVWIMAMRINDETTKEGSSRTV